MKKFLIFILVLVVLAGGAGGWYYVTHGEIPFVNNNPLDEIPFEKVPFLAAMLGRKESTEKVYVSTVGTLMGVAGVQNRFAGVVEPQETVEVNIENGRRVSEVLVKTGENVKAGQLLFEYDLSSIEENLQQARLEMDQLRNQALSYADQIATLENEKQRANAASQLSYTIEIESNRMNLQKNQYDQRTKQAEIEKLEKATGNTQVYASIDGIVQKIDTSKMNQGGTGSVTDVLEEDTSSYGYGDSSSTSNAFITILSTGAYRVKGKVNELNLDSIIPGSPVIVRSRVDDTKTWTGTMGNIDMENSSSNSGGNMYYGGYGDSSDLSSTTYPFYVELDNSSDLMLGQHVYIERDEGQDNDKAGVWLSEFFIVDVDKEDPYVYAANDSGRIEKRYVILGSYDGGLMEYEIVKGLTYDDRIAFPSSSVKEGASAVLGSGEQVMSALFEDSMADIYPDDYSGMDYDDYGMDSYGMPDSSGASGDYVSGDYMGDPLFDSDDLEGYTYDPETGEYYKEETITYTEGEDVFYDEHGNVVESFGEGEEISGDFSWGEPEEITDSAYEMDESSAQYFNENAAGSFSSDLFPVQ